jgi:hypothetical protein
MALRFASERLKNNKTIVSLAVQKDGLPLEFASDRLRNDEEIVSLAVQNDGEAL